MKTWSILERLLVTERVPRRATRSGDFARPAICEGSAPHNGGPFVASNARGRFVVVPSSSSGTLRSGFSDVELEDEGNLLSALFTDLWTLGTVRSWPNRCSNIVDAVAHMSTQGLEPKFLVVGRELLKDACGKSVSISDAEKMMQTQGFVAEINGTRVLVSAHLAGYAALLTTAPSLVGVYTRADDCLSVLIHRADRSIVLVDRELRAEIPQAA